MFFFPPQLLEMVERNELNMSLLTLLDENIANAKTSNQVVSLFHIYPSVLN
jgi:hypothetical protein